MFYPAAGKFRIYLFSNYLTVIVLLSMLAAVSCRTNSTGTDIEVDPGWTPNGLSGTEVTVLKNDGEGLLIGTEDGLYRLAGKKLVSLGLKGEEIRSVIQLKEGSLLAGIRTLPSELPPLVRSRDEGKSWEPFKNGFRDDANALVSTVPVSDTLYAQGSSTRAIVRSTDSGRSWQIVAGFWDNFGGLGVFVKVDPFHPGRIWSGGTSAFFLAYLTKLLDNGERFEGTGFEEDTGGIGGTTYDVMTHPEDPDLVLAGLGGSSAKANAIRKSTDGGQSWQVALEKIFTRTFARSLRNPEVIYASGRDPSGKLIFARTSDFGETWEREIFEESPSPITTNDLAVLTIEGSEVLFFGTDQGLFSFGFEK